MSALPLALVVPTLPAATAVSPTGSATAAGALTFDRTATYPVFQNVPEGVDPAAETVAEISTVTEDGNTVIYTDAAGKRIGFVDITDPDHPVGTGTLDLSELGHADDQPTSVAVSGDYVLVVVDTSGGDFVAPSGRLDVVRISDRTRVRSIDLGGQPDSIALSPDGAYAAIAMENQRDEDATPEGGEEGDLPQLPAGFVQVVELAGAPASWSADPVALPAAALAGLHEPTDAEPEYVDVNDDNQLVLTLQENNGIVVIDLPTREIVNVFSAGNAVVDGVDTDNDGVFDFTDSIDLPREPDSVQWVGDDLVATANEGDLLGGTRGWTVFDTTSGEVVWDAGASFENLAVEHGLFNNDRADNKGAEPEGLAFAEMGGVPYAFVGSERSNFVAVYDMTDPTDPQFRQVLPATNGPEGLLPIPSRDLLVVSSETDDASALVRASISVYELGAGTPAFPTLVSGTLDGSATPIGWGALGALSGVPGAPTRLWAASDAAYATGRIYGVDVSGSPARIDSVVEVTAAGGGAVPDLDIEGLAARTGGGFWLASEGATGPENAIVRTDAAGVVQQTVALPADVAAGLGKWGLEGVAVRGSGASETLFVALQRPLAGEQAARLGRYDVSAGTWTWFAYPLSTTSVAGDWVGLSEITVVRGNTLAVIERDKQNGTTAALKRIYTVRLPAGSPGTVTPVTKRLAVDVLPALRASRGWTQEKLEGLGVTTNGRVFAVTDNDGVDDATGETQLLRLGSLRTVFAGALGTTTGLTVARRAVEQGKQVRLVARVASDVTSGRVRFFDRGRALKVVPLRSGTARTTIRLGRPGRHVLRAVYLGAPDAAPSSSARVVVRVTKRR